MDAAAEIGRNPVSKHQIQPEHGDEQADAGRDCRTRLARPNSQARTRTGKYLFTFPVQLTTSRIGNLTRLILTLAIFIEQKDSRLLQYITIGSGSVHFPYDPVSFSVQVITGMNEKLTG